MDNKIILPKMNIEERISRNSWGINSPDQSNANLNKELQLAIQLNQDVWKSNWEQTTLEVLNDYIWESPEDFEIVDSVKEVMGHQNWKEVSIFVRDDMCTDFFNRCLSYCLREEQTTLRDQGFIDGSGVGYMNVYMRDLKISLEKAFDVKYYYKLERPLEWALSQNIDLRRIANHIHPGHWSFVAGHGTKFYQAVKTLSKIFNLSDKCYRTLIIAAGVEALGRSGNLIHYPMDNCEGRKLVV